MDSTDSFGRRPLDQETFDALTSSNSTQVVSRPDWPDFTEKMEANGEKVAQVLSWSPTLDTGVVEVVREFLGDSNSTEWKRDRWYVGMSTDGDPWITRKPDKDIEGGSHHSTALPAWHVRNLG